MLLTWGSRKSKKAVDSRDNPAFILREMLVRVVNISDDIFVHCILKGAIKQAGGWQMSRTNEARLSGALKFRLPQRHKGTVGQLNKLAKLTWQATAHC